jgi:hypothetical protein
MSDEQNYSCTSLLIILVQKTFTPYFPPKINTVPEIKKKKMIQQLYFDENLIFIKSLPAFCLLLSREARDIIMRSLKGLSS